jgi:hypothetical protein
VIFLLVACSATTEPAPIATPVAATPPGCAGACPIPEGWTELASACAARPARTTPADCAPPGLDGVNPLTGAPYTAGERARVGKLATVAAAARLVPGTPAYAARACVELPAYRAATKALRHGSADPAARADFHCLLLDDLAARTAVACAVTADPTVSAEAAASYAEMADCRNVEDQRARIVALWRASAR